jgi:hypothetical protein
MSIQRGETVAELGKLVLRPKFLKECRVTPEVIAHLLYRLGQHIKSCFVCDGKTTIK